MAENVKTLQKFVEDCVPYKSHTIGVILDIDVNKEQKWRQVPLQPASRERRMLQKAVRIAKRLPSASAKVLRRALKMEEESRPSMCPSFPRASCAHGLRTPHSTP